MAVSRTSTSRARTRLVARGVAGLIVGLAVMVGQVGMGGSVPASAADGCQHTGSTNGSPYTCTYTQLNPYSNWPSDGSSPFCNPCLAWWMPNGGPGDVPAVIQQSNMNGVNFYDDARNAMYDWAGQNYNSPWMYECPNCSSSQIQVTFSAKSMGTGNVCGQTSVTQFDPNRNIIDYIWAGYNTDKVYWDGPPRQSGGCNAKTTAYHEFGHVFGLGHSSDASDIMYWGGNNVVGVTGDAQTGLNAIYGAYQGGNSNCGSGSSCQLICTAATAATCVPLEGYLEKAWSLSQGTPAPNPVTQITSSTCPTAVFTTWYTCMFLYEEQQISHT